MRRAKLDKIDRKILRCLQDDGRMSNVNIAKEAGISAPPCLRRVRSLEKNGLITSYHATINPASMGYTVSIFALVSLTGLGTQDKETFEQAMNDIPEVRECHSIAGDIDYMLKIVAHDWNHYQEILKDKLTSLDNVKAVKSCLSMSSSKNKPGIPIQE